MQLTEICRLEIFIFNICGRRVKKIQQEEQSQTSVLANIQE